MAAAASKECQSSTDSNSLYARLGVPRNATQEGIEKAFRELARKAHPDKGGSKAEFQKILNAYEVLSDPTKRAKYDASLHHAKPIVTEVPDLTELVTLIPNMYGSREENAHFLSFFLVALPLPTTTRHFVVQSCLNFFDTFFHSTRQGKATSPYTEQTIEELIDGLEVD